MAMNDRQVMPAFNVRMNRDTMYQQLLCQSELTITGVQDAELIRRQPVAAIGGERRLVKDEGLRSVQRQRIGVVRGQRRLQSAQAIENLRAGRNTAGRDRELLLRETEILLLRHNGRDRPAGRILEQSRAMIGGYRRHVDRIARAIVNGGKLASFVQCRQSGRESPGVSRVAFLYVQRLSNELQRLQQVRASGEQHASLSD